MNFRFLVAHAIAVPVFMMSMAFAQSNSATRVAAEVGVDHQTSFAIEASLDSSAPGPLFKVGHGELVTAGGVHESVDLFSHLNNDMSLLRRARTLRFQAARKCSYWSA
jgi:hypothetical protein